MILGFTEAARMRPAPPIEPEACIPRASGPSFRTPSHEEVITIHQFGGDYRAFQDSINQRWRHDVDAESSRLRSGREAARTRRLGTRRLGTRDFPPHDPRRYAGTYGGYVPTPAPTPTRWQRLKASAAAVLRRLMGRSTP